MKSELAFESRKNDVLGDGRDLRACTARFIAGC